MAAAYPTGRALAGRSRGLALAVVIASYAVAAAVAAATVPLLRSHHPLVATLGADVAATLVVFLLSMLVANSSLYDPYWSVAPPVVALAWLTLADPGVPAEVWLRRVVVAALVVCWAVRLTGNWVSGWRGFGHEDWRYVRIRRDTAGRLPWWLVSLAGIQLMPTLVVFAGMLPLWPALVVGGRPLGPLDAVAFLVTAGAVAVESIADLQLRRFVADPASRGRFADRGLWAYSRHPNYLGEIGFWCGLWLFGVSAAPSWWWTVIGPLGMILLFRAASIPLMEARLLRTRPGYAAWAERVPRLLPRPRPAGGSPEPGPASRAPGRSP